MLLFLTLALVLASDSVTLLDYISKGSIIVFLVIVLYGGYKKWWVWGYQLTDSQRRENEWRKIALDSMHTAESATSVGEHLVERNKALREGEG